MRAMLLILLAACGGGDGGDAAIDAVGSGGTVDANVTLDGTASPFAASCRLTEDATYLDITATTAKVELEIKWKKAIITAPGTYPTGGIIGDILLYARRGDTTLDASGSVTFTTYAAPALLAGTFTLMATGVSATGTFDCHP